MMVFKIASTIFYLIVGAVPVPESELRETLRSHRIVTLQDAENALASLRSNPENLLYSGVAFKVVARGADREFRRKALVSLAEAKGDLTETTKIIMSGLAAHIHPNEKRYQSFLKHLTSDDFGDIAVAYRVLGWMGANAERYLAEHVLNKYKDSDSEEYILIVENLFVPLAEHSVLLLPELIRRIRVDMASHDYELVERRLVNSAFVGSYLKEQIDIGKEVAMDPDAPLKLRLSAISYLAGFPSAESRAALVELARNLDEKRLLLEIDKALEFFRWTFPREEIPISANLTPFVIEVRSQ